MSLLFSPLTLPSPSGALALPSRIVVTPMCQYAAVNGEATDWHLMHWGNLLNSGAGMFTIEATAVLPKGRITPSCLGVWDPRIAAKLADILHRARKLAPTTAGYIQLARAFLYQPRWSWQATAALGDQMQANPAYWRCLPHEAQAAFGPVTVGGR
jgi:2,4-dienoyl-CoA reductase-like NADH-dependent reductase (Old Yellow Enzyme family)